MPVSVTFKFHWLVELNFSEFRAVAAAIIKVAAAAVPGVNLNRDSELERPPARGEWAWIR